MYLWETLLIQTTPPNSDCYFLTKFGFRKCFGTASQSNDWAGHCRSWYTICSSWHIRSQWRNCFLSHRINANDSLKKSNIFFVSSWGTHLTNVTFQFASSASWLCLSWFLTISPVLVTKSALMMVTDSFWWPAIWGCDLLLCVLVTVLGPNALLMWWVTSLLYNPFWTGKWIRFI